MAQAILGKGYRQTNAKVLFMHDHVPMYANMYGVCCSKLFVNAVTHNTIKYDPGEKFKL